MSPSFRGILVAGVDEAGRGPLAGPVCVAAVILDPARGIDGLNDSKQLSERRREALYPLIVERALAWRIEFVEAGEIDALNILQATMAGMRRALAALSPCAQHALIDGNRVPDGLRDVKVATLDEAYQALVAIGKGQADDLPHCEA